MPFNVPLDTLYSLMRYSIFVFSRHAPRTPEDQQAYESVLSLVLKSCSHSDPSFSLFHLESVCGVEQRQRWQVLVAAFLSLALRVLRGQYAPPPNHRKSQPSVATIKSQKEQARVHVRSNTAALLHHFAEWTVQSLPSSSSSAESTTALLRLGTVRAVAFPLCILLRDLCAAHDRDLTTGEEEGTQLLTADIANILRVALSNSGSGSGSDGKSVVAGVLGAGSTAYQVRVRGVCDSCCAGMSCQEEFCHPHSFYLTHATCDV
jgi:hypothetical protein